MDQQLQKYKDNFITLCEAGFIATNQADEDAASKLFKASQLLDPSNTLPDIGMGYLSLLKLDINLACKWFEDVLKKEPTNEMAKALLGLTLVMSPDRVGKGEKILHDCATGSHDNMVKKLSESAIDFVDKFVKKSPTPVQGPSKDKKAPPKKKDK